MELRGKTREQIEAVLASRSRAELLDLIFSLVTVEQLFKPAEIAARSRLNKRAVLRDIRDGKFGDYYCRAENSIAVPASGVNTWRRAFRVPGKQQ
jgi:ribosomal protein L29